MDLFEVKELTQNTSSLPLAERLRPKKFEDFVGQRKALVESGIQSLVESGVRLPNLILWGPPGTGKTTFALLLAQKSSSHWVSANAIDTGAKRIREIGEEAHQRRLMESRHTILFIDEIHRLNKGQQDVLLPFTEKGDFSLVGATTENPSYELNRALLSRSRVIVFDKLQDVDLKLLLGRAECELKTKIEELLSLEAIDEVIRQADGDARQLIGLLELVNNLYSSRSEGFQFPIQREDLSRLPVQKPMYYDKSADEHYDCISAFIKSVRGSDPDAAVYYLARMLAGGEDPVFIARRLVILASEDIGNADPRGLSVAVAGLQAVELIGLPEAAINLAQVTTYLASAPKSNRSYMALKKAQECLEQTGQPPIPMSLRSSKTELNRQMGYGKGYLYSHEGPKGFLPQQFLPDKIKSQVFYEPLSRGFEKNIIEYLKWMKSSSKNEEEHS